MKVNISVSEFTTQNADILAMVVWHQRFMNRDFLRAKKVSSKLRPYQFEGVSDVISESTLSYFPEIREVKICQIEGKFSFQFVPMWGEKLIKFNFRELSAVSYLIEKKERGVVLGSI